MFLGHEIREIELARNVLNSEITFMNTLSDHVLLQKPSKEIQGKLLGIKKRLGMYLGDPNYHRKGQPVCLLGTER
eukprot:11933645-Ditylum_brightwellii.AAC.1